MTKSPSNPYLQSRRLGVSGIGVVGALLVHALIVLPFVLNLSLPSQRPPKTTGAGASAFVSAAEPDMTVVFIEEASPVEPAPPPKPPVLASRGMEPPDLPLVVLSPDPSPATVKVKATDTSDAQDEIKAEAAEHARLYGRYVGQVQARIERAWVRPRSEIGAPRFSCQVRIKQDRQGDVVGIDFDRCNGTERWQASLLSAIRTASPLPAPPDPSVYADQLWLNFQSDGFRAGGSPDGFEPETQATWLAAEQSQVRESFEHFVDRRDGSRQSTRNEDSDVIHLTIIGDAPIPAPTGPREAPVDLPPDTAPPSPPPQ